MEKKRTIWQNLDFDFDDWKYFLEEEEESRERKLTDDEKLDAIIDLNNHHLDDERLNLDINCDGIAIADIGRWYGRIKYGYKTFDTIADCLYSDSDCDYVDWYCDSYDFKASMYHHDGSNYIVYREFKENISDTQKENFLNKLYYGKATKKDFSRYTKSLLPKIKKVYGWE